MIAATMSQHFSLSYLADEIGKRVPAVKTVFADQQGDFVSVWTVVSNFERDVRNEIYDAEAALIDEHPDMRFDFHVLAESDNSQIPNMTVAYVR